MGRHFTNILALIGVTGDLDSLLRVALRLQIGSA